jgi:hypothetical protein
MIEQSTENSFSQDNSINAEQIRSQNHDELHQRPDLSEMLTTVIQLSKQIKELDKKNTGIEEKILSIKKDIKGAVSTLETVHQITSDSSTIIKEFHDEIARLQMQIQKIELSISNAYKSKKIKKYNKDKKHNKKDKKRNNKGKDKDKKKNKKKAKSLKKMKKQK